MTQKMPDFNPVYVTEEPNKEIVLRESEEVEVIVGGVAHPGRASVSLRFLPHPSLVVHAWFLDLAADLCNLKFEKILLRFPSLAEETEVLLRTRSLEPATPTPLRISFTPTQNSITIGDSKAATIRKVKFHVVNFCEFYSDPHNDSGNRIVEIKSDGGSHRQVVGCATILAEEWRITLSALPSIGNLVKGLERAGGYAITHVGEIERLDRKAFDGNGAEYLLDSFHFFLSFVRGSWTPPVLPIGLNKEGEKVWEKWDIGNVGAWRFRPSWFDEDNGQLLAEVFPGFWRLWRADIWHWPLRMAIQWYLCSNTNAGDAGIILTQAALELLAWTLAVKEKRLVSAKAFGKKLSAAAKLRLALSSLNIPTDIPAELTRLTFRAKEFSWLDGPQAFATIRNRTVHPHHKGKPESLDVIADAWRLGQWYVELILLALCGHVGKYSKRLGIQRMGAVIPVPWAT